MKKYLKAPQPLGSGGQGSFNKFLREHKALCQGSPSSPGVVIHHLGVWLDKGVIHHFQLRVDHSYSCQLQSLLSVALQEQGRCDERHRPGICGAPHPRAAAPKMQQGQAAALPSVGQSEPARAAQPSSQTHQSIRAHLHLQHQYSNRENQVSKQLPFTTGVTAQAAPKSFVLALDPPFHSLRHRSQGSHQLWAASQKS